MRGFPYVHFNGLGAQLTGALIADTQDSFFRQHICATDLKNEGVLARCLVRPKVGRVDRQRIFVARSLQRTRHAQHCHDGFRRYVEIA